jgi:hypothetical protein
VWSLDGHRFSRLYMEAGLAQASNRGIRDGIRERLPIVTDVFPECYHIVDYFAAKTCIRHQEGQCVLINIAKM